MGGILGAVGHYLTTDTGPFLNLPDDLDSVYKGVYSINLGTRTPYNKEDSVEIEVERGELDNGSSSPRFGPGPTEQLLE